MDTQNKEAEGWQNEGESLNTGSANSDNNAQPEHHNHKKGGIHNNALFAAGMARPATAQVDPHNNSGLANTGTNISYEGATAPGGGGSVGTGYASGKEAVDETMSTSSDYDEAAIGKQLDKADGDDTVTDNGQSTDDEKPETGPAMGY